jgi:hypothetical protein
MNLHRHGARTVSGRKVPRIMLEAQRESRSVGGEGRSNAEMVSLRRFVPACGRLRVVSSMNLPRRLVNATELTLHSFEVIT